MDVRTYQVATANSKGGSSSGGVTGNFAPIKHKHSVLDITEDESRVFLSKEERANILEYINDEDKEFLTKEEKDQIFEYIEDETRASLTIEEKKSLLDHLKEGCGHDSSGNGNTSNNNNVVDENRTYIYREGFESVDFSGDIITSGYNRDGGSVYKFVDFIDINCKGSVTCTKTITHSRPINLGNFKKIKIDYLLNDGIPNSNKGAGLRLSSRNDLFSDHTISDSYYSSVRLSLLGSNGRNIDELDISEVSGHYYIHVGLDQWGRTNNEFRIFIKNIWLE